MSLIRSISVWALAAVLFNALLLTSCGPAQESQHMQTRVDRALDDRDRDRGAVRLELIELRRDIDNRMMSLEEELQQEDMTNERRSEKQQLLRELEDNRNRVQQALLELERADDGSWHEIRTRSKKLTRSVDNWFERQAEKEDMKG